MENLVRTVYGAAVQTANFIGKSVEILPYSTLNEKFDVAKDIHHLPQDERLTLGYMGIGIGGHRLVMGNNGVPLVEPVLHRPTDASLYRPIPFVIRPAADDLSAGERAMYRLRREETYNGKNWICYYLKAIDYTQTFVVMNYTKVTPDDKLTTTFEPSLSNLNPTPPIIDPSGATPTTGDYVSASAFIPFLLTDDDVAKLKYVAQIIYGDERYAMVTEIAFVTGVDKPHTAIYAGQNLNYLEAIDTQCAAFVSTTFFSQFNDNTIDFLFDVGASEGLIVS